MRQRVQGSSHVEWIDWDPGSRTLTVEYRGGRIRRYDGVEYETWVKLQRARSKGSFLRREIQLKYPAKGVAA